MVDFIKTLIDNRLTQYEIDVVYGGYQGVIDTKFDIYNEINKIPFIDQAARLILDTIDNKGLIVFCGDFDNDGITSAYISHKILTTMLGCEKDNLKFIIGKRVEGRGITDILVDKLDNLSNKLDRTPSLFITADHGSNDESSYARIKELYPDIKIIVTDHHHIDCGIPPHSDVFINTQREDCNFSKNICGCATIFLVLLRSWVAMTGSVDIRDFDTTLPFVGMATIVDMMSMKDPINRYLVKEGLKVLNDDSFFDRNIDHIVKVLNIDKNITFKDVGMSIGPLINTANRLGAEDYTLLAFITDNDDRSLELFKYLHGLNKLRKSETDYLTQQAIATTDINTYEYSGVSVIDSKALIAGVVAGNLSQYFSRPFICFTQDYTKKDKYIGSGRAGVEGFNLLESLREIENIDKDFTVTASGHAGACGVVVTGNIDKFKSSFDKVAKDKLINMKRPVYNPEIEFKHSDIHLYNAKQIMDLGPYGLEFKQPIITTKNVILTSIVPIRTFYKLTFKLDDGNEVTGMMFFKYPTKNKLNMVNFLGKVKKGMHVDINYHLSISYFRGIYSTSLEIIDIIPT